MTSQVWTWIDRRDERLLARGLTALGQGRGLAGLVGAKTTAVLMAGPDDGGVEVERAAAECAAHGADHVLVAEGPTLTPARAEVYAAALCALASERGPRFMLTAVSGLGREVFARAAARLGAGLIADAESFALAEGKVVARCPAWGGEAVAEIYFADPQAIGLITLGPHHARAAAGPGDPGTIERVRMDGLGAADGVKLISSAELPAEHLRLEEAERVVVGGAGLGGSEGFARLRELAAALGAEVGATRPAVLAHWASEEHLIGQTGKTVRPRLLLSIGTSGAVQYTAGITGSDFIVAVNRDPHAPIFGLADVGVVADAKSLVPVLTDKVKSARMKRLADLLGEHGGDAAAGFGAMVARLREAHGLGAAELAEAIGQDPDYIAQVEAGEVTPSVAFLLRLAKALNVDPNTFLTPEAKSAIRDERAKAFITRTENYTYETLTPGAQRQHLRGFLITIEPRQTHKPVAYKHEGEEFVYVMAGWLELTVGTKVIELQPGESHHFNSDVPHKLRSLSNEATRCLVILYTP
jgi:electron transfer flavoprotein alpha subunit